jgi:hypothetical protein
LKKALPAFNRLKHSSCNAVVPPIAGIGGRKRCETGLPHVVDPINYLQLLIFVVQGVELNSRAKRCLDFISSRLP